MGAILKFDFQKRPNFVCGNYIFPKTRGNKNKPWTHSTPLNLSIRHYVDHLFGNWRNLPVLTFGCNLTNILHWPVTCPVIPLSGSGQNLTTVLVTIDIIGLTRGPVCIAISFTTINPSPTHFTGLIIETWWKKKCKECEIFNSKFLSMIGNFKLKDPCFIVNITTHSKHYYQV